MTKKNQLTEVLSNLLQVDAAYGEHLVRNVLKSIVHRSGPELMHEISSRCDWNRTDDIENATELADFADELWNERNLHKKTRRSHRDESRVIAIESMKETRHVTTVRRKGISPRIADRRKEQPRIKTLLLLALLVTKNLKKKIYLQLSKDIWPTTIEYILDSGCGRHLTGNPNLFGENTNAAGTSLISSDGTRSKSLRIATIEMVIQIGQERRHINVEDVASVPGFKRNMISSVHFEKKGVLLICEDDKHYLSSKSGIKLAEVQSEGDVLIVRGEVSGALANAILMCSVVEEHV